MSGRTWGGHVRADMGRTLLEGGHVRADMARTLFEGGHVRADMARTLFPPRPEMDAPVHICTMVASPGIVWASHRWY